MSWLSIDFQPLYAVKGSPRCLGRRRYISSNIGMHFKDRGEWRHGNEYCTQTPKKSTLFSGQYLRNRSTLDIGVLGYIGIVWPKEHSPEVRSAPPVTPCILKNTLKSYAILLPRHVSDHTGIHPQGAITRSWLKYLQVHGASPYRRYCGCIGDPVCVHCLPCGRGLLKAKYLETQRGSTACQPTCR